MLRPLASQNADVRAGVQPDVAAVDRTDRRAPVFGLLIGAMKAGTSGLYDAVREHPEICECRAKEPNFVSRDERWAEGFEAYRNLWDFDPRRHRVRFEGSTSYTKIPRWPNAR